MEIFCKYVRKLQGKLRVNVTTPDGGHKSLLAIVLDIDQVLDICKHGEQ